ncbi:hypothetical protein GW17_00039665 [Ensete ventricosum]|nr:hypothetical protein GW17_00039665 [Ensete ventricosum]
MLDTTAKDWPVEETLRFAKLALKCAELRRKDLQDLGTMMQPKVNQLRNLRHAYESCSIDNDDTTTNGILPTGNHFVHVRVVKCGSPRCFHYRLWSLRWKRRGTRALSRGPSALGERTRVETSLQETVSGVSYKGLDPTYRFTLPHRLPRTPLSLSLLCSALLCISCFSKFRIYFSLLRQWSLHQIQGTETTPSTPSVSVGAFSCATEMVMQRFSISPTHPFVLFIFYLSVVRFANIILPLIQEGGWLDVAVMVSGAREATLLTGFTATTTLVGEVGKWMDEMPAHFLCHPGVGSSLCDAAVEIAQRKRTAEEAEHLLSGPMAASGSDSIGVVEQIEAAAPTAALEEEADGDGDDPITESDLEDSTSVEPELSVGSSCSVVSDSSSISCAMDGFSISNSSCKMGTPTSVDAGNSLVEIVPVPASVELLAVSMVDRDAAITPVVEYGTPQSRSGGGAGRSQSLFLMESLPLWGCITICGRRPEMEDAVVVVPNFFQVPLRLLTDDEIVDGLDPDAIRLPLHFFGVYDGHGGAQVADYCREHLHLVLIEQLRSLVKDLGGSSCSKWKRKWEKVFVACFHKVDDEVGGKGSRGNMGSSAEAPNEGDLPCPNVPSEPVAPDTVGSTAVVAVISSSHVIIANCGDSRAVLCRDRYLKPWIIPEPEITFVQRAREDECLIVASDGLWDVMSNEEVCDVARKRILLWHKKNGPVPPSTQRGKQADPAAQAAADCLSKLALQKGSRDNITIIVVDLKAQRKFKSK